MFSWLGQVVCRAWWLMLAAWIALVVGTKLAAPSWKDIAQDKEFTFLPEDEPSRVAAKQLAEAFPDARYGSNIVLVMYRARKEPGQVESDNQFIEDVLYKGLTKIANEEGFQTAPSAPSN